MLTAALALIGVTTAMAVPPKLIEVDTRLTLKFFEGSDVDGDYYEEGRDDLFFGKVSAKKRCRVDRKVTVLAETGERVGTDRTGGRGRYAVRVEDTAPGRYLAVVKRRTYRNEKGTRKIVCQPAG